MTHLSIVVPCFNEEEVLPESATRLLLLLQRLMHQGDVSTDSKIYFIDDGSEDATWSLIEAMNIENPQISGIKLSRNRGHQNALLAGLLTVPGDVVISLDADLQDDIEIIPKMLAEFNQGAEIVYGVRAQRTSDSFFKRFTAQRYYKLMSYFDIDIVPDHADYRLMTRRALQALQSFNEVNLFLRGVIPLLGFKTAKTYYERQPRFAGETKYPLHKMLALAFEGITSFSSAPLKWITWLGGLISLGAIVTGGWALFIKLFTDTAIPGWASIVVPIYFLGGLQMLSLGIIGGYLAKIYSETKRRPRFIIEKAL